MIKINSKSTAGDIIQGLILEITGKSFGLCGTKRLIQSNEKLTIPAHYEYNVFNLEIDGFVDCEGIINLLN